MSTTNKAKLSMALAIIEKVLPLLVDNVSPEIQETHIDDGDHFCDQTVKIRMGKGFIKINYFEEKEKS